MSGQDREQTVYGRKACWAIFSHRAHDIQRIYYARAVREELAPLLKWAASTQVLARELDEDGLRRVSGATHHEGLVLSVRPLTYAGADELVPGTGAIWVALDGVANPYNVGAILRSCAFFGVERVLVGGVLPGSNVNTAAIRAAEGGAESVKLVAAEPLAPVLLALASRGVPVIGLESDARSAFGAKGLALPSVLVLGHEQHGLSPPVRSACTQLSAIPGKGAVSSLNVSVTAGIALALLTAAPSSTRSYSSAGAEPKTQRPAPSVSRKTKPRAPRSEKPREPMRNRSGNGPSGKKR